MFVRAEALQDVVGKSHVTRGKFCVSCTWRLVGLDKDYWNIFHVLQ